MTLPEKVLGIYKDLQKLFPRDQKSRRVTDLLENIAVDSIKVLERVSTVDLTTSLKEKTYFSFQGMQRLSRPVNRSLFLPDISYLKRLFSSLRSGSFNSWSASELTSGWYTASISFCCLTDAFKTRDQKTPATYFEYLMGHILASVLKCNPTKQLDVLSRDLSAKLPTDFIFDLGEKRTKFHVPVKTSTRERVIQVWAHQRVLDGIYGAGRYRGILTCLSETKLDHRTDVPFKT